MQQRTQTAHLRLPARPTTVGRARRFVRAEAADLGATDLVVENAELLVSELASNAVVHAGTPVEIRVSTARPDVLLVEVRDGSPHQPVPRNYGEGASTGRGLRLLEEMADAWGVRPEVPGKTVWFRLTPSGPSSDAGPGETTSPSRGPDDRVRVIAVELLDVPLSLHTRWQERAEGLLRDHLLASLDQDDAGAELVRHAQCSDAMALLEEALRAAEPTGSPPDPETEDRTRAVMRVPQSSAGHFAVLEETLDVAIREAESQPSLALPTDDEMQAFRRWVCREVQHQADGERPTPWHRSDTA